MYERMRGWSRRRRSIFMVGIAVTAWLVQFALARATPSVGIRLAVDVVVIVLLGWVFVTFMRVALKESEEAAQKNPRHR